MVAPSQQRGQGGGTGWLASPGLLAAGAAGFAAAFCALWAFRGLPLGVALLWLAPLPLFLAGLGFGVGSAAAASLLASLLVAVMAGGGLPLLVFVLLFAIPAPVLAGLALPRVGAPQRLDLSGPLVMLGAWPIMVLFSAALVTAGEGGLEAALRRAAEGALARMGMAAGDTLVGAVARVQAAALGFWSSLALLANGAAAQSFLARRGLARAAAPDLRLLALPGWYPLLPALGAGLFLAAAGDGDTVALSALLLSLVPLFVLGVAGVHVRARGRPGRMPMLAIFYVLLVLFLQLMGPAMVALGLVDHFRRRRGAAPTQT